MLSILASWKFAGITTVLNFSDFIWLLRIVVDLELSHSIGVLWILAVCCGSWMIVYVGITITIDQSVELMVKICVFLFQALKKALFKPSAFFKGILLPLCEVSSIYSPPYLANIWLSKFLDLCIVSLGMKLFFVIVFTLSLWLWGNNLQLSERFLLC